MTIETIKTLSLNQVETLWRNGRISGETATQYVRAWNAGPHITQCVIADGAFRTFEPKPSNAVFYRHYQETFNLQLEVA